MFLFMSVRKVEVRFVGVGRDASNRDLEFRELVCVRLSFMDLFGLFFLILGLEMFWKIFIVGCCLFFIGMFVGLFVFIINDFIGAYVIIAVN